MLSDGVWACVGVCVCVCVCVCGGPGKKKWFGGDAVGGGEIGYDAAKKYQEIVGALDGGSRKRTQPCRGNIWMVEADAFMYSTHAQSVHIHCKVRSHKQRQALET
ncbi:hypothetical protein BO79DRAFT_213587 [Aspergillus costaricaensis CBS 115574]|uniref:Uncharacterized protein n=1 Tax=Aspergillus costaricaensis CBS 115574 TaxID=1448317 RepID=A0ACD1IW53_9EURO|nr:hypothetical protein BO79DRAFT_213587 [Aspergillus costaricaensis CBS 115574]RAK93999.1 hypothetical protein BO79DRAFT_213587 [Aspergillus costaricaensis CBS 115574]